MKNETTTTSEPRLSDTELVKLIRAYLAEDHTSDGQLRALEKFKTELLCRVLLKVTEPA